MSRKRFASILLCLIMAISLASTAMALDPGPDFYVTDEAGVLSP